MNISQNDNILVCFGTRPEYIKVKSLIDNLQNIRTCFTGQHIDLIKGISVDYQLDMVENMSENRLNNIICNILKYNHIFENIDYVLVQGDTTTALAIALSAFNNGKKIIHLEAGLRSNNLNDPYPEEANRQIISRIANIHLCPTEFNKKNLLDEKVNGTIKVIGNTGLDNISKEGCEYENKVLITLHRRDNHEIMDKWFIELEKIANKYSEIEFLIPLHPNPNVQKYKYIFEKVKVIEPLSHDLLIEYLKKCRFIISDSGGLQEECSYLNKKIIVCRKTTERPESVGIHSFMCESPDKLSTLVDEINMNFAIDQECPYGNGESWKNIIDENINIYNDLSQQRYSIIKKYIPIDNNYIVLGIGEGYRQTIPENDVKIVYNCDYYSTEEIINTSIGKEADGLQTKIIDVDFVCKDNNYLKSINKVAYFDLIISNHCIEHLDDIISFFKDINVLLKDNGYFFFTLPDKKYSFDNLRSNTDISHLIYDYKSVGVNTKLLHVIESELFYNNKNPPDNSPYWLAKNRIEKFIYKKDYEISDNRFSHEIHPGIHRHVFEVESFVEKIIEPLLWLYFDNFELVKCEKVYSTGEFFTILKKKKNAKINFPKYFI